jgi:hypothetical protein
MSRAAWTLSIIAGVFLVMVAFLLLWNTLG